MSAFDPKRTSQLRSAMSAFGGKADIVPSCSPAMRRGGSRPSFCYDARVNFGGEVMIMRHLRTRMKTMITKEQFDAIIKAVNEGGDDDDEITEDEVIAILRDTGLDTEIPYFQELFAWERSRNRPQ